MLDAAIFKPTSMKFPGGWCGHLPFAWWVVGQKRPNVLVELGTHTGNSYFSFCQSVVDNQLPTKCYAVDTWKGDDHAGSYDESVFDEVNTFNRTNYSEFSFLLRATFDEAVEHFSDQSIDLLHIDGLHTYEAVNHDFYKWLPKLASGALVLLHDTNVRERGFGVWKFWDELKKIYPSSIEFFHSYGLGVIQLNCAEESNRLCFLDRNATESMCVAKYFTALGCKEMEKYDLLQAKIQFSKSLSDSERRIDWLTQEVEAKRQIIEQKARVIEERNKEIQLLINSTCWRLTKPVRYVGQGVGHLNGLLRPASAPLVKVGSALKRILKRFFS